MIEEEIEFEPVDLPARPLPVVILSHVAAELGPDRYAVLRHPADPLDTGSWVSVLMDGNYSWLSLSEIEGWRRSTPPIDADAEAFEAIVGRTVGTTPLVIVATGGGADGE